MDYSEEQKISSPVVLIIFCIGALIALASVALAMYTGYERGENMQPMILVMLVIVVIEAVVYYMVFQMPLQTSIDADGFSYRYFPYVRTKKTIAFNDIQGWKIRKIKSIWEFGGYGYKKYLFSKKIGLIMGGDDVIELRLDSKKIFVFSTHNVYMISSAMKKYISEKELK
jgi:hypothetical protein